MKYLTFILSAFILCLAMVPCGDSLDHVDKTEVSSESTLYAEDVPLPIDICSPLCNCHCCHSHLIMDNLFTQNYPNEAFPAQNTPYFSRQMEYVRIVLIEPPIV